MKLGGRHRAQEAERNVEEIKAQAEEWVEQTRRGFLEARSKLIAEVESARAQRAELETLRAERVELERAQQALRRRAEKAEATVERLRAEAQSRSAPEETTDTRAEREPEAAGAEKRDRASIWGQVRRLSADGYSQREIARRLEINRRTVARMLAADEPPHYRRVGQGSMLDPLEPVMRSALADSPRIDAPSMTEILREHGYRGSVDLVRRRLHAIRAAAQERDEGSATSRSG